MYPVVSAPVQPPPRTVGDNESCPEGYYDAADPGKKPAGTSDPWGTIAWWLAQLINLFTVVLGSAVAWLAATILNIAVRFSLDSASYGIDMVSLGWTMARDLANMAFIFILVYIAVQVMFQAQTHGTLERLVKVLAVALIINFSFFGTRVVIDMGNLISVQFYNAIVKSGAAPASSNTAASEGAQVQTGTTVPDLTSSIMNGINFTSALKEDSFKQFSSTVTGGAFTALGAYAFTYIVLGAALFMLAAAFVAAGIKFIIRIVMLWFSIITAPFALVMWAFQSNHGHGGGGSHGHGGFTFSSWLKGLINHAFYPALFLFVLFLITKFMGSIQSQAGGLGSVAVGGEGWQSAVGTLANIVIRLGFVLVMLYFALKASDYFEVAGSSAAKALGNRFAFNAPSWAMRNTVGRGANFIANRIPNEGAGKFARTPFTLAAKGSYDPRSLATRIPGAKDLVEKEFGKPAGKGGFEEAKHHSEAELKKAVEAEVKKINEHGDGAAAEIREQAKFQREYDRKYGTGALNKKVKDLTTQLERFRHESTGLAQQAVEATTDASREAAQRDLKDKQNQIKNTENQLKAITGVGKKVVDEHNKAHKQEIAIKLMSSGKVKDYLVGQKILNGKSSAEKIKDAVKEADDEDKGGGEKASGSGAAPKSGPGGDPHGSHSSTIDGHASHH